MEESFLKAKSKKSRRDIILRSALYAGCSTRETKMSAEISFLKKEIAWYQERRKRKLGSEKVFCLPIPIDAKPELKSVILATRLGTLIMEDKEWKKTKF